MATVRSWDGRGLDPGQVHPVVTAGPGDTPFDFAAGAITHVGGVLTVANQPDGQYVRWLDLGLGAHAWRFYWRVDTAPGGTITFLGAFADNGGSSRVWGLTMSSGRQLQLRDTSNAVAVFGPVLDTGVTYRIEVLRQVDPNLATLYVYDPSGALLFSGQGGVGTSADLEMVQVGRVTSTPFGPAGISHLALADTAELIGPFDPDGPPAPEDTWRTFLPHVAIDDTTGQLITSGLGRIVPLGEDPDGPALEATDLAGVHYPGGLVPVVGGMVAGLRVEDHTAARWVSGGLSVALTSSDVLAAAAETATSAARAVGVSKDLGNVVDVGTDTRALLDSTMVHTPASLVDEVSDPNSPVRERLDELLMPAGAGGPRLLALGEDQPVPSSTPAGTVLLRGKRDPVVRRWDAVGLADGTVTTSSAGEGDTPFDAVAGAPAHASGVITIVNQPTGQNVRWLNIGLGDHAWRFYWQLDATPSGTITLLGAFSDNSASVRLWSLTMTTGRQLQLRNAANSAVLNGPTLTNGETYRIEVVRRVDPDSVNLRVYDAADSLLYNASAAIGSDADLNAVIAGRVTSTQFGPAMISHLAVSDTAELIGPYSPSAGASEPTWSLWGGPSTSSIAYIGDSLTHQDGSGPAAITAGLMGAGWDPSRIYVYAVSGKRLIDADTNGKTGQQSIDEARAALGGDPDVWVIALGTNDRHYGSATIQSNIATLLAYLGTGPRILVVGVSLETNDDAVVRANTNIAPAVGGHPGAAWLDWDAYIKAQPQSGLWRPDGIHMNPTGYALRNAWIGSHIGSPEGVSEVPLELEGVWDGETLVVPDVVDVV